MSIFSSLFTRPKMKRFSAWQIELTTRCPLKCRMCIKEEYRDWQKKDMPLDDFKRIVPYLDEVEYVVLEGWGESLMHRNLIDCVKLIKGQGTKVGFVTSGMGFDITYASRLVEGGLDFMGFSFSGATRETHNRIRVNSDFDGLLASIRSLKKIMKEKSVLTMHLHIVYLMLKDNISEVPLLIDLALDLGIKEIVLIHITHVTNAWQDNVKVFSCKEELPLPEAIEEAKLKAKKKGITLTIPSFSPRGVAVCSENPLRNLYISVDGEVSPCVYLYPPISSPFKRIFCGEEKAVDRVSFGNIYRESIEKIWNREEYRAFRDSFIKRQRASERLYEYLIDMKRVDTFSYPEAPEPCQSCHKILGF